MLADRVVLLLPPLPVVGRPAWHTQFTRALSSGMVALGTHRWRSALTMVSVLLGVAGVLAIDSIGHSQRDALSAQLAQLGTNLVLVQPGAAKVGGVSVGAGSNKRGLLDRDVERIREQVPHMAAMTPQDTGQARIVAGDLIASTTVVAANAEYRSIQSLGLKQGTFFGSYDQDTQAHVAVIGQTVGDHLFSKTEPVGRRLRIRNIDFTVIGVLSARGHNAQIDLDDIVIVPFGTGERYLFGPNALSGILIQADQTSNLPSIMSGVKRALEISHDLAPGRPDDFQLTNFQQIVESAQQQSASLTGTLTKVAVVALAMGGLGIMNIMLLSVTERTQEIGLLIAVGAQRRDVLLQFLAEAVALSLGGGLAGLLLGYGVAATTTRLVAAFAAYPEWPSPSAIALSLGVSLGIGVAFGLFPAVRAAWLDPILALRSD